LIFAFLSLYAGNVCFDNDSFRSATACPAADFPRTPINTQFSPKIWFLIPIKAIKRNVGKTSKEARFYEGFGD